MIARGFTLVEVIVSMSLAALLLAITGRVAVQLVSVRRDTEIDNLKNDRVSSVLDHLAEDLRSIPNESFDGTSRLLVFGTTQTILQFHALAYVESSGNGLHVARRPSIVRYRISDLHTPRKHALAREQLDLTKSGAEFERETIGEGVTGFAVQLFCGDQWTPQCSAEFQPLAIQVTCAWQDRTESRVFLVPNGN